MIKRMVYERYMSILARPPPTLASLFVPFDRKEIVSTGIDHEMVEVAGTITLVNFPVNLCKTDLDPHTRHSESQTSDTHADESTAPIVKIPSGEKSLK